MIDNWKERFIKKFLFYGVPAIVLFSIPCIVGPPVAIPLFIPILAIGIGIPLTELIGHFFPNIFWSQGTSSKPRPIFSIARALKNEGKYDESLDVLREMTEKDPQEIDIWLEMLEVALMDMQDESVARDIYREALSVLEKQESRDVITRFYTNITGSK